MQKTDISLPDVALALVLLTRLPLPRLPDEMFSRQSNAVWAFPLAGIVVSALACFLGFMATILGLPASISSGLMISSMVLMTGAMHEDGLADSADGLWGGFEKARRLEIMKDSRIGVYGVLALVLAVGLRWGLFTALLETGHYWAPVALAAMSRATMPVLMAVLANARGSGLSQQVGRPPKTCVALGIAIAFGVGLMLLGSAAWAVLAAAAISTLVIGRLAHRKIGGQTGDILGAMQQVSELACGMVLLTLI